MAFVDLPLCPSDEVGERVFVDAELGRVRRMISRVNGASTINAAS